MRLLKCMAPTTVTIYPQRPLPANINFKASNQQNPQQSLRETEGGAHWIHSNRFNRPSWPEGTYEILIGVSAEGVFHGDDKLQGSGRE